MRRHQVVGNALGDAGDEWAAVVWFYSAYHLIKGALLRDPIWSDLGALANISLELMPEDRFTSRHRGRRRANGAPREWGVNELVLKLYRKAAKPYDLLHQASISVRYGAGLPDGALPELREALEQLMEMDSNDELTAPILWDKGNPG